MTGYIDYLMADFPVAVVVVVAVRFEFPQQAILKFVNSGGSKVAASWFG